MLKTREDKRKKKAERTWTVEKVERDGAPDLTTLTHSGLSLLASCALWSIRRGHTRTHIYLSTHAGDEDILGLFACVCECVFGCDSLSMRAKASVDATRNPTVCVCFPSSLFAFVFMSLNLYAHLCVYTYIYTSAGERWCSFPSVFLAQQLQRAGYWCVVCPPVPLHHLSLFAVSPHVCHVCEPLAMSSTNGVIRNKCSKVRQSDPTTPQRSLPTILCRIVRPPFPPLEPDCYPTCTSPQIEMVLLTGNVGTLCFQSGAPASADWPSKGLFLPCVEYCWTGRRERCRKCNMVKESKRGKFPLNTAVCHVCISF